MSKGQSSMNGSSGSRKGSKAVETDGRQTEESTAAKSRSVNQWRDAETTGLDVYFAKLRELAPLCSEEQIELARRYRNDGDHSAADLLLSTNLRLVVKIAREYCRRPDELLDLIQEGNLGLVEALERFDPTRGVKFTTYAQHWIRAMIMGYLINQKYPVRLGSSRAGRTIFYNLNKARKRLRAAGKEPTSEALAEELDVGEDDIMWVSAQLDGGAISMDRPVDADSDTPWSDVVTAKGPSPEEELVERQQSRILKRSLDDFGEELTDPRDRCIWFERTIADEPKTLRELGDRFEVSKERIRQIEVKLQQSFAESLREELPELMEPKSQ